MTKTERIDHDHEHDLCNMDIGMIVRERDCIAEIKSAVHGHYYENDDD